MKHLIPLKFCLVLLLSIEALKAQEFNYVPNGLGPGKCLNSENIQGLNAGLFGDCGDLKGSDFSNQKFQDLSLRGADLSGADLSNTVFIKSNLESINLTQANLVRSVFDKTNLRYANLLLVEGDGASFNESNLEKVNLSSSKLIGAAFDKSFLFKTRLYNVNATDARFRATDLTKAVAILSNFTNARFNNANLEETFFFYSNFTLADLSNTVGSRTNFNAITCDQTRFSGSTLEHLNFENVSCVRAMIDGSVWRRASFHNSKFSTTDMAGSDFGKSLWLSAEIVNCKLEDARFTEGDFRNSFLQKDGWGSDALDKALFGPLTMHSFSAQEIRDRGITESSSRSRVTALIPKSIEFSSYILHPQDALRGMLSDSTAINTVDDIEAQLSISDVYVVPLLFLAEHFQTSKVTQFFKSYLGGSHKRLILLGPNEYFVRALLGDEIQVVPCADSEAPVLMQQDVSNDLHITSLPIVAGNIRCNQKAFRWSSLPPNAKVLYGSQERDEAYVFMVPFERGEIWSVSFSYGNIGFKYDREKDVFYRILRSLSQVRHQGLL